MEPLEKIPSRLWSPLLSLFFDYCAKDKTVMVEFLHSETNGWKIIVPRQKASSASVEARFDQTCDLVTGERYSIFPAGDPPDYYRHAGGAYCHNTMLPFFSATTDENELSVPGIHLCVGKINLETGTYELVSSRVRKGVRTIIPNDSVVEMTNVRTPYHPMVREFVS